MSEKTEKNGCYKSRCEAEIIAVKEVIDMLRVRNGNLSIICARAGEDRQSL